MDRRNDLAIAASGAGTRLLAQMLSRHVVRHDAIALALRCMKGEDRIAIACRNGGDNRHLMSREVSDQLPFSGDLVERLLVVAIDDENMATGAGDHAVHIA